MLHQASEVHHIYSITRRYDSTDPGGATLYIALKQPPAQRLKEGSPAGIIYIALDSGAAPIRYVALLRRNGFTDIRWRQHYI